ncbi:MAG: hypothetical protein ACRDSP_22245 [Pseudonocardiaceae bacterium]
MSVAELLARCQGERPVREPVCRRNHESAPIPTPSPSAGTETGQMFVTDLLRREGRTEEPPPSPPARPSVMYRVLAVVIGLVLLSGAVAASTAALSGPRTERAAPRSTVPASFTGPQALRPDLINASVKLPPPAHRPRAETAGRPPAAPRDDTAATQSSTAALPRAEPGPARTAPGRDDPQPPRSAAPQPGAETGQDPSRDVLDPNLGPILGTVTAFFDSVAVAPRQAFDLLGPQMQGPGWPEFRDGWAGVEQVTVDEIHPDGPNAVLVTTSLRRKDGSVLHTVQRVLVIPGAQPRITDARLLSASRS